MGNFWVFFKVTFQIISTLKPDVSIEGIAKTLLRVRKEFTKTAMSTQQLFSPQMESLRVSLRVMNEELKGKQK